MLPANGLKNVRRRAERAAIRKGVMMTCPASRHLMLIAEHLMAKKKYHLMDEAPEWVAGSIYSVLESLWKARRASLKTK